MVLLYHAIYWTSDRQPNHLANLITQVSVFGWLGVNLFFILSGFLITGILIDSAEKPHHLRTFYLRRVQRILPAYLLCIALLWITHVVSIGGILRAITFTANYQIIPAAKDYGPFWSLSVEEQFYLFWPLIVLLSPRRLLWSICIAFCFAEPILRYLVVAHSYSAFNVHTSTFLIADSLTLGAVGALLVRSSWVTRFRLAAVAAALAVIGGGILYWGLPHQILHRVTTVGAALQVVPFELFFTAFVFGSLVLPSRPFHSALFAPLRFLGYISYGLYLIHVLIFFIYDRLRPVASYEGHFRDELIRAVVCITISITLATISRRHFEEFFLRKRPMKKTSESVQA